MNWLRTGFYQNMAKFIISPIFYFRTLLSLPPPLLFWTLMPLQLRLYNFTLDKQNRGTGRKTFGHNLFVFSGLFEICGDSDSICYCSSKKTAGQVLTQPNNHGSLELLMQKPGKALCQSVTHCCNEILMRCYRISCLFAFKMSWLWIIEFWLGRLYVELSSLVIS